MGLIHVACSALGTWDSVRRFGALCLCVKAPEAAVSTFVVQRLADQWRGEPLVRVAAGMAMHAQKISPEMAQRPRQAKRGES